MLKKLHPLFLDPKIFCGSHEGWQLHIHNTYKQYKYLRKTITEVKMRITNMKEQQLKCGPTYRI
jgi:hypothetical protein